MVTDRHRKASHAYHLLQALHGITWANWHRLVRVGCFDRNSSAVTEADLVLSQNPQRLEVSDLRLPSFQVATVNIIRRTSERATLLIVRRGRTAKMYLW